MNLADRLSYLASAKFPFHGGWVAPSGSNPTVVAGGVTLDDIAGAPAGDKWLRAYFLKLAGNSCDTAVVELYVRHYGTETEDARYRKNPPEQRRALDGIASALVDPTLAVTIYGTLAASENPVAKAFAPLLAPGGPGIDIANPATAVGINQMEEAEVLTADLANALRSLPLTDFC